MLDAQPLGPLRPGTYVIESDVALTEKQMYALRKELEAHIPDDVHVVVLNRGLHMARTEDDPTVDHIPVTED